MNPTLLASAVLVSVAILLANIGCSGAIRCYQCMSALNSNGGCGSSDFNKDVASESADICEFCQKTVASSSLTGEVVTRDCAPQTCTEGGGGLGSLANTHIYCCQEDLCNDAVKISYQLLLQLLTAAVTVLGSIAGAAQLL